MTSQKHYRTEISLSTDLKQIKMKIMQQNHGHREFPF